MMRLYPWLTPYFDRISTAFAQGYGHHALLFKADTGLGAEQLIRMIAHRLICQSPENGAPCEICHSCHLFQAGNHPDFHLLAPIENKDIGVDQVREINEKVNQHAQQNGNKVVFVQEAERLTENAVNALLKTLEEPRPNTYFLLQTDLSEGLLEKRREFLRQFWVFYSRRSPLEILPHFDKTLLFQQIDWLAAFLSDALKDKLGIRENWISQDLERGIQQFNQKQTVLGLLKANQILQKMRLDLSLVNAVNQELILLDGLTRLITEVFEN